jgi:hypothetical protein
MKSALLYQLSLNCPFSLSSSLKSFRFSHSAQFTFSHLARQNFHFFRKRRLPYSHPVLPKYQKFVRTYVHRRTKPKNETEAASTTESQEIEYEEEAKDRSPYTPAIKQYLEIKEKHPDFLLLFQIGDFYEMYFDDAKRGAELLDIAVLSSTYNSSNKQNTKHRIFSRNNKKYYYLVNKESFQRKNRDSNVWYSRSRVGCVSRTSDQKGSDGCRL